MVIIAVRMLGLALVLLGSAHLLGMFTVDLSMLTSPGHVALRYSLMVIAGVGFLLTYKWAIFVSLGSLAANWVAFFLIYDGHALAPIWLSFPIPLAVTALTYFAWDKLKPTSETRVEQ